MSLFPDTEYLHLLKSTPEAACVEKCVLLCRSLTGERPAVVREGELGAPGQAAEADDDMLALRGAMLGSAQGIRVHAAMAGVELPGEGELHIVDWNAEQGFHTMALLEVLIARGELHRVCRITLVHPNARALERARCAVALMAGDAQVETFRRYFPGREGQPPLGLRYEGDVVVHLLGDCLCGGGIDLELTAYLMAAPGVKHVAVSVSACGAENFAGSLAARLPGMKVLARREEPLLCHTQDFRPVSLRSLVWTFEVDERLEFPEGESYTAGDVAADRSDYDLSARLEAAGLGGEAASFLADVQLSLEPHDRLLLLPELSPCGAHVGVVRPDRGMMLGRIVNVHPSEEGFMERVHEAVDELRDMRRQLALYLPDMDGRERVRRLIKLVVIAGKAAQEELPAVALPGDAQLVAPDVLHSEGGSAKFARCVPQAGTHLFPKEVAQRGLALLYPRWHWDVKGRQWAPDEAQRLVADSSRNVDMVLGGWSSGKTLALLHRAAHHWQRTGERVLAVVPDAAALGGMLTRMERLFADFSLKGVDVAALPDLQRLARRARRYEMVLVDDAQFVSPQELDMLRRSRLKLGGRMTVFANPLEARTAMQPEGEVVCLTGNYSPLAEELRGFVGRIAAQINPALPKVAGNDKPECVVNLSAPSSHPAALAQYVEQIMEEHRMPAHATLVTGESEELLRDVEQALEDAPFKCLTTFSSHGEVARLRATTRNARGAESLSDDSHRHRFTERTSCLKLAPVNRLRGVNFRNVIYLYRRTAKPDYRAIYRVITRTEQRLVILSFD